MRLQWCSQNSDKYGMQLVDMIHCTYGARVCVEAYIVLVFTYAKSVGVFLTLFENLGETLVEVKK